MVARSSLPTIPDVARKAGVSTATAARALGNYGSVSEATRERVAAAAAVLGYRPNVLARSMITGQTHTIGVVVGDIENAFFSRALRGISDVARAEGWQVILVNTDEDDEKEQAAISVLVERRVDGLVVCPTGAGGRDHLRRVIDQGTPVVLLDRPLSGLAADSVGIDNHKAGYLATEYLLRAGHRRIGVVTGADDDAGGLLSSPGLAGVERMVGATAGWRTAGYRDALLAAGIDPSPDYVTANGYRRENAEEATRSLMALPHPPTAILALDSVLSLGTLQGLRSLGLSCPEDVSILGFDDVEWADAVTPPLTVLAQPVQEIGARCARRLLRRIEGSRQRPVHEKLGTTLIERASVAPPRRALATAPRPALRS